MNINKKHKRLRYLIHKYDRHFGLHISYTVIGSEMRTLTLIEYLDRMIENSVYHKERNSAYHEIKKLVLELNITKDEYAKISSEELKRVNETKSLLDLNTLKETRDNKGVYVGGGGSNANKTRYPKKNRSKRTWRIFYKMFPSKAQADDFDGDTSKRMK